MSCSICFLQRSQATFHSSSPPLSLCHALFTPFFLALSNPSINPNSPRERGKIKSKMNLSVCLLSSTPDMKYDTRALSCNPSSLSFSLSLSSVAQRQEHWLIINEKWAGWSLRKKKYWGWTWRNVDCTSKWRASKPTRPSWMFQYGNLK